METTLMSESLDVEETVTEVVPSCKEVCASTKWWRWRIIWRRW
jgi:hypothetical protein